MWTRALGLSLGLIIFWHTSAFALEWEIERNFRYFLYPSDVAVQRVARDIYTAENGVPPTPEQSELQLNDADFWTTPLARAGALRERWPIDWPRDGGVTIFDLVKRLRLDEGRQLTIDPAELSRLGWATLLAAGRDAARPTGFTDTCWNPGARLHNNCSRWGDYVRPPGWIVRVFDPGAPAGQQCSWTLDGAVIADRPTPPGFQAIVKQALAGGKTSTASDCREIRFVVPSDPADPKHVAGRASVTRTSPDGVQAGLVVTPQDRLVIGFGDSFTSGEGNPERHAIFNGRSWTADRFGGSNLPARDPDPTSVRGPDTRAQWTDRWCHRSVYSWQIRSALYAALSDPHQSLTILPYGCSGSEILAGLLYEYNGVEWSHATDHGVIGSRAAFGLAYQEMCEPQAFRSPYCRRGDPSLWCGRTAPPSKRDEAEADFYDSALPSVRRSIARCGQNNVFKRSADALFLDIRINDVGFSRWVAGLILTDPTLRYISNAFVPCFDSQGSCAQNFAETKKLYDTLDRRYALLRKVLDQFLLPDFGIAPSHVIVPIYPPGLENEEGKLCPQGNAGLTVATFASFVKNAHACEGGLVFGVANGVISAYPTGEAPMREGEEARQKLNDSLRAFALSPEDRFDLISAYESRFLKRGVCATQDAASRPLQPNPCFDLQDLMAVPCAPGNPPSSPESMHVPRTVTHFESCLPNNRDPSFFHPFPPGRFEPYRHRTRLLRTQNDVFITINQRPNGYIDSSAFGTLDLTGRTTGGAFHPTAEAHAIIANETARALCDLIGCVP